MTHETTPTHGAGADAPDEYLWDRSGPPDPQVQRLEQMLSAYRYRADPRNHEALAIRSRSRWIRPAFAAAAVIALAMAGIWLAQRPGDGAWDIVRFEGTPQIAGKSLSGPGRLRIGDWLTTDRASSVLLARESVGHVTVDPGSRVRLLRADRKEQRLELAQGRLDAFVTTPPRVFLVETPAATAVDYGCKYSLEVTAEGSGLLQVTLGQVRLEAPAGTAIVPAGAVCRTLPGSGPGIPVFADAPEAYRSTVAAIDDALADSDGQLALKTALDSVLHDARPRDALTLWHLLPRLEGYAREATFQRLAALVPPPAGVTREGVLALDQTMLDRWWTEMFLTW